MLEIYARRDPFMEMHRRMSRIFHPDESVANPSMAVDISESDGSFVVEAALPGADRENINVILDGENMRLSIESTTKSEGESKYHRRERRFGRVRRTIALPNNLDFSNVESPTYRDGVLTIAIPKKENEQVRKLEVK